MIEVILNDRLGKKIRVKCNEDDTVGDLKKLVAAQARAPLAAGRPAARPPARSLSLPRCPLPSSPSPTPPQHPSPPPSPPKQQTRSFNPKKQIGTRPEKIRIQKWYNVYKDHITLADYEVHDGMGLELYYN